jgi:hypothetical protein
LAHAADGKESCSRLPQCKRRIAPDRVEIWRKR